MQPVDKFTMLAHWPEFNYVSSLSAGQAGKQTFSFGHIATHHKISLILRKKIMEVEKRLPFYCDTTPTVCLGFMA